MKTQIKDHNMILENIDDKDKTGFVLEIDNMNDVELLESLADDPIINHSR